MPTRLYLDLPLSEGARLTLPDDSFRHAVQVLRLREGESLLLFDGKGAEFEARLVRIAKRSAEVEVGAATLAVRESPLDLTLLQGVSKGERMDWTIQKSVELGYRRIVPIISEYCQVRLDGERWDRKLEHWRAIARSASEQSGRTQLPTITAPLKFGDLFSHVEDGSTRLLLDPEATASFQSLMPAASFRVLIGPEGGFSPPEVEAARASGFIGVRAGPRILRTETAGVVAAAALQLRFGDLC